METNELKNIWKTLAEGNLIGKELAEENIERIISLKSSDTVARLNKKLKFHYAENGIAAVFIIGVVIFTLIFKQLHNQNMSRVICASLFLLFMFFVLRSFNFYKEIKLLNLSSTSSTIKDSLNIAKSAIEKTCKREMLILYILGYPILIIANVSVNKHTDFAHFNVNSLEGYLMIVTLIAMILMPFTDKKAFQKNFSGIIKDISNSLNQLNENKNLIDRI